MKKITGAFAAFALAAGLGTAPAMAGTEPELVEFQAPQYPRAAERRSLEGHVLVRYNVGPEGEVLDVEVVEATPAGVFERAVLRALEAWRYAASGEVSEGIERRFDFAFSN